MRTLSPTRSTAGTPKRSGRRRTATSTSRRRYDSALPRFLLVPRLPGVENWSWLRWNWQWPRIQIRWNWLLALLLVAGIGYTIYWTQSSDRFFVYRDRVAFENIGYLNADELYQLSDIDTWNVFWLRSETVRQRLLSNPFVADAQVTIEWPAHVTIRVLPTEPVAVWSSGKGRFWLMSNGFTRPMEQDAVPALPQIIDPMLDARTVASPGGTQIQKGLLDATLTLYQRISELGSVNYNNEFGLNFALPATNTMVYWGDERNLDKKFVNLEAAKRLLNSGQSNGSVIDLRTADRPVIR